MGEIKQMWDLLASTNAAVLQIAMDYNGTKNGRMIVFIEGAEEVADVKAALDALQTEWDKLP